MSEGKPLKFKLRKPCDESAKGPNCPFRKDCVKGWLGRARAEEIAESILDLDQTFPCHKTTYVDDNEASGVVLHNEKTQMCVGALMLIDKEKPGGNFLIRFAERFGLLDRSILKPESADLVFDTRQAFIDHHSIGDPAR